MAWLSRFSLSGAGAEGSKADAHSRMRTLTLETEQLLLEPGKSKAQARVGQPASLSAMHQV